MFNKMKNLKNYVIIAFLLAIACKIFKMGGDKEKLKNYKANEKKSKKSKKRYKKIISDSASKSRKWLHNKKRSQNK